MASGTVPCHSGSVVEFVHLLNLLPNPTVMLYTIAVILIILWLLGIVSGYTIGSFIHILLVIAIVMILLNFITGRRTL